MASLWNAISSSIAANSIAVETEKNNNHSIDDGEVEGNNVFQRWENMTSDLLLFDLQKNKNTPERKTLAGASRPLEKSKTLSRVQII